MLNSSTKEEQDNVQPEVKDNKKYFGLVVADLDHSLQTAKLKYTPRRFQPLSDGHREKCLKWALDWCKRQGLNVDLSGVSDV